MKLYKKGVTVEYTNPKDIAWMKRNGYVEVKEEAPKKDEGKPEAKSPRKKEGE